MKRVYIISRYRASTRREQRFNERVAKYFCRRITEAGGRPVAPHLFYTRFLDDNDPEERSQGLRFGLEDLRTADSFLLVIIDGQISEGMKGELVELSRGNGPQRGHIVSLTRKEAEKRLRAVGL